jgi:hypothetical protein
MKWKTNKETPVLYDDEDFIYVLTATSRWGEYCYQVIMYNKYTKGFVEPLTLREPIPVPDFWAYIEEPK